MSVRHFEARGHVQAVIIVRLSFDNLLEVQN
jgi:hypothetical protein